MSFIKAVSFKRKMRSMCVWICLLCVPALAYKAEPDFPQVCLCRSACCWTLLTVLLLRALQKLPTARGSGLHPWCSLASPNPRNSFGDKKLAQPCITSVVYVGARRHKGTRARQTCCRLLPVLVLAKQWQVCWKTQRCPLCVMMSTGRCIGQCKG